MSGTLTPSSSSANAQHYSLGSEATHLTELLHRGRYKIMQVIPARDIAFLKRDILRRLRDVLLSLASELKISN